MTDYEEDDAMAQAIFRTALNTGKAGELLHCLFEGGSATVDPNGKLIMITEDQLKSMGDAH
jgi:hypothetical protein